MIRYLEKSELGNARPLWQEAFPEDSREFGDYYFNKKLQGGRVLVKEDGSGRIVTMAHLNPYKVRAGMRQWTPDYIVGVATAADSRHQGHMRDVLTRMLGDLHQAGKPFCFLMPASPDIYRPFGFRYIFDQPVWKLTQEARRTLRRKEITLDGSHGLWINRWLEQRYEVYALRDSDYMDMLQAELCSEAGQAYGWYAGDGGDGSLEAIQAFWGLKKRDQRFLYCMREEWTEPAESGCLAKPAIMARITDVAAWMEAITLDESCPGLGMEAALKIHDPLIPGNDGLWRWRIGRNGSLLARERMEQTKAPEDGGISDILRSAQVLDITIDQLAEWLSGYRTLEETMGVEPDALPFWCRYVRPFRGVFLDEVV